MENKSKKEAENWKKKTDTDHEASQPPWLLYKGCGAFLMEEDVNMCTELEDIWHQMTL